MNKTSDNSIKYNNKQIGNIPFQALPQTFAYPILFLYHNTVSLIYSIEIKLDL